MTISKILGLGNDIIEIARLRQSIERQGAVFLNRLFTPKEQEYCHKFNDSAPHFAGRFAAKEAIAKALGTGFGADLSWLDIEILNNELGKPIVYLSHQLKQQLESPHLLVSISHNTEHAVAVAIWS